MQAFLITIMEKAGYFGVCFLVALENIFPPIPSELILTFGGFMTVKAGLSLVLMIIAATIGSVLGAIILYFAGRMLGFERLEKKIEKRGKFLGLKKEDLSRATIWYTKYQKRTVFFCRMIPLIRSLISVPAGMSKMNFSGFVILTAAGSLIWNSLLMFAGAMLGNAWSVIIKYMRIYSYVTYILIAVSVIILILVIIFRKKRAASNIKKKL